MPSNVPATVRPSSKSRGDMRRSRPRTVLPSDRPRRAGSLEGLRLDGRKLSMRLGSRLVEARLERGLDVSQITLGVFDADKQVMRSRLLGDRVLARTAQITVDGLDYGVVGLGRRAGTATVTCEDAVILTLKAHGLNDPIHATRGDVTRAEFVAGMWRDAGVPVLVLDEQVIQPITGARQLKRELEKAKQEARGETGGKSRVAGIRGPGLTIKGQPANQEQRRVMGIAASRAGAKRAPELAALALFVAIIQESQAQNLTFGDATSTGVLQVLTSTAAGVGVDPRDIEAVVDEFLENGYWRSRPRGAIELARANPSWTPGQIAQECQGSAHPTAYDPWLPEARRWLKAAGGGQVSFEGGEAHVKDVEFERLRNESSWKAGKRLLDEVRWRGFIREGVAVIASDVALARAEPSLRLAEGAELVDSIDFEVHTGLAAGEATGQAILGRYRADPGEVAELDGLPQLEADSAWLIVQTGENLLDPSAPTDLQLRLPQPPLKEPAGEIVQKKTDDRDTDGSPFAGGKRGEQAVARLWAACKEIHDAGPVYDHGTHGVPLASIGSGDGQDCSSSTSLALFRAGLFGDRTVAMVSDGFLGWGEPGYGKYFTVFVKPGTGMNGHVYLRFKDGTEFNTAGHDGVSGPRLGKFGYPTAGLVARRWPGL